MISNFAGAKFITANASWLHVGAGVLGMAGPTLMNLLWGAPPSTLSPLLLLFGAAYIGIGFLFYGKKKLEARLAGSAVVGLGVGCLALATTGLF